MSGSTDNRFFDDLARFLSGVRSIARDLGEETSQAVRARRERWLEGLGIALRDEALAIEALAVRAREQGDALRARMEAVEARLARLEEAVAALRPVLASPSGVAASTERH